MDDSTDARSRLQLAPGSNGARPSSHLTDVQWNYVADALDFTRRQLEIVRCIVDGHDEQAIGNKLGISAHTVHAHLNRLYRKTKVRSRCDLVVRVLLTHISRTSRRGRSSVAP